MFAIAFDLVIADTLKNHQKSVSQALILRQHIRAFRIEQWSDFTHIIKE